MKYFADENIHAGLVAWLRLKGDDVLYVAEGTRSIEDEFVLALAEGDHRILLTDDKDFGELVFLRRQTATGVVLIRLTTPSFQERMERLQSVWPTVEQHALGHFIVISDKKVRIRPLRT